MNSGSVKAARSVLGLVASFCILLGGSTAFAETPNEACAADSLYLVSPDAVSMKQQVVGRPGLIISWGDLDTREATCFTLTNLDSLNFSVAVDGGFGDNVDRLLAFTTADSGSVGHHTRTTLQMAWQSQGSAENGVLAGNINLANNGGILTRNLGSGLWGQANSGLPMTWFQTNVTSLAEGSGGFLVASFTSGQTIDVNPQGLWVYRTGVWSRVAADIFNSNTNVTRVAVSAASNDVFAVGTSRNGLFVTHDGGATFTQFRSELEPAYSPMPVNFNVSALDWSSNRLVAFLPSFGLFISNDNGNSFVRSVIRVEDNLDSAVPNLIMPAAINEITVDPANSDRILLALNFNGIWESTDGGLSWHNLYGDLNVPDDPGDPDYNAGEWSHSAKSVAIDGGNSQVLVGGFVQEGLYRSADGGTTWTLVGQNIQPAGGMSAITNLYVRSDPDRPGRFYVLEDGHTLAASTDGGVTWAQLAEQPYVRKGRQLRVSRDGSGDLLMASYGGGIYVPGTAISLSQTYNTTTSANLRTLDLGLEITFGTPDEPGVVDNYDLFNLVCQTFQGWAVWRAPSYDQHNMVLLGIYDRVNPESCIEGYCGDSSYDLEPQCYISKRAACFNFDTPDTIRFFDDEIYNGFSYVYAVSTFDYGNTALSSPQNNSNAMIFSPRFPNDTLSPFEGVGNAVGIQINSATADPVAGETIYAYPNPLRRGAGIPGSEGETVIFTNLPPQSRVRVFTTAGDDVINLGWDNMRAGNIYWRTVNRDGEPVAPGVYLYKVESPSREDHWGKVVIIR